MDDVPRLLGNLNIFHRCIAKALDKRAERETWTSRARLRAKAIEQMFRDTTIIEELDQLLAQIHETLQEPSSLTTTVAVIKQSVEDFIAIESQLREVGGLTKQDFVKVVYAVKPFVNAKGMQVALSNLPKSATEFSKMIIETMTWSLVELQDSLIQPRNQKKKTRKRLYAETWKQFVGCVVAVSNAVQTDEISPEYARASVAAGALLLAVPLPSSTSSLNRLVRKPPKAVRNRVAINLTTLKKNRR